MERLMKERVESTMIQKTFVHPYIRLPALLSNYTRERNASAGKFKPKVLVQDFAHHQCA
jgi:hypothetical protein